MRLLSVFDLQRDDVEHEDRRWGDVCVVRWHDARYEVSVFLFSETVLTVISDQVFLSLDCPG